MDSCISPGKKDIRHGSLDCMVAATLKLQWLHEQGHSSLKLQAHPIFVGDPAPIVHIQGHADATFVVTAIKGQDPSKSHFHCSQRGHMSSQPQLCI